MGAVGLFVTHYLETNFTLWGSQLTSDCQENMHLCWYRFPQNEYDVIKTINVDNLFFLKAINCGVKPSCAFALFTLVASIACQCLLKIPNF